MTALLVVLGGAVGAPLRYLLDQVVSGRRPGRFPWGTLCVNVVGSLVLGAVVGAVGASDGSRWVTTLVGTGFCGALTTFSTFGFETVRLVEDGEWRAAAANVTASLALGLAACAAGYEVAAMLVSA
jgi:fluoride exporter